VQQPRYGQQVMDVLLPFRGMIACPEHNPGTCPGLDPGSKSGSESIMPKWTDNLLPHHIAT
jgi:hypothetical protein